MLLLLTGQLVGTVVMPMWELVRKGRIRELKDTDNLRMPPIVSLDTLSLYSSRFAYEDAVVSTGQLTQLSFRDVKCNVCCHTKAHHRHENPQWALKSRRCGTRGREGTRNLSKPWQKQKLSPKNCSAEQVELNGKRSAMPLPAFCQRCPWFQGSDKLPPSCFIRLCIPPVLLQFLCRNKQKRMLVTSCYSVQKGSNTSSFSDKQWACSYICLYFVLKTSPKRTSFWYIYFPDGNIGVSGESCSNERQF